MINFVRNNKTILSLLALVLVGAGILVFLRANPQNNSSETDTSLLDTINQQNERIANLEEKILDEGEQTKEEKPQTHSVISSSQPVAVTPSATPQPKKEEPKEDPPPCDQGDPSWTNSHGTYCYSDLGKVIPMHTGKDYTVTLGWSASTCPGFKAGDALLIPTGTKITNVSSINMWTDPNSKYAFDLTERYNSLCPDQQKPQYFFYFNFSSTDGSIFFPGKFNTWW